MKKTDLSALKFNQITVVTVTPMTCVPVAPLLAELLSSQPATAIEGTSNTRPSARSA